MERKSFIVRINSIDKVKKFVGIVSNYVNDIELISGRYVIDAKSIMGIFSLDLSKDIELVMHNNDNIGEFDTIERDLSDFIVKGNN